MGSRIEGLGVKCLGLQGCLYLDPQGASSHISRALDVSSYPLKSF